MKLDGTGVEYFGTFLAPESAIQLSDDLTLTGGVYGYKVELKNNSVVNSVIAVDLIIEASKDWLGFKVHCN